MNLNDKKWDSFIIEELFDEIVNSKAYHEKQLNASDESKFPYITRTSNNNGLKKFIDDYDLNKNPKNTIVFGAESAKFFYEPFEYITGNKMYYIKDKHFNKYICLFLVSILNNNIGSKFSYSRGLTARRLKKERIILPVNENNEPDYEFMEKYAKNKFQFGKQKIVKLINKKLGNLESIKLPFLSEKKWDAFFINEIGEIYSGKDISKKNMIEGDIPYISSTSQNNGIRAYVGNKNSTLESDCISINRNGSVGYAFYHPYFALFSNDCRKLKINKNKHVSLFITNQIKSQKDKYNYGYKMGTDRLKRQKILLPIADNGEPDYEYMKQYMINLEIKLLRKYIDYSEKK